MGSFFSKTKEEYIPNFNKTQIFYQVSIKKGSTQINNKIIKCLQVSDFNFRPINYKVHDNQSGGGFFNFMESKKPLFIFCCENTFEARMTLFFSWIKFIDPNLPILIINSRSNQNQNKKWEQFNFNSEEIKRLTFNSPNFSLKKIKLLFKNYSDSIDPNEIIRYYIKEYGLNLENYDGIRLVFIQEFQDMNECEILDINRNPVFPGSWVNSEFVKDGIFNGVNPLVDGLFLPDYDELMKENDLNKLTKLEKYLRFLIMHYSGNLGKIKEFKNIKIPDKYFFNYQNMRDILIDKIKRKRI